MIFIRIFFNIIGLVCTLFLLNSCSLNIENSMKRNLEINEFFYKINHWGNEKKSNIIVIAVHGFSDYSKSFVKPATFFSKFNIQTLAYDLRGFGINKDFGEWYPLDVHVNDLKKFIKIVRINNPKKKIYILGESMGGAIVCSLAKENKALSIDGVILISPALWNFSESNPFKRIILKSISSVLPSLKISGKGAIKVRPSDNLKMLKKFSEDPKVVHKPTLKSLNGIIELMDKSFEDAKVFFSNPHYDTLIIIPIIDEIVPRRPILKLFNDKQIQKNLNKKIFIGVYEKNFHMILRDIDGVRVTREIKEWIVKKKSIKHLYSFSNSLERLKKSNFYHKLD